MIVKRYSAYDTIIHVPMQRNPRITVGTQNTKMLIIID